jgi:hypothetical protein
MRGMTAIPIETIMDRFGSASLVGGMDWRLRAQQTPSSAWQTGERGTESAYSTPSRTRIPREKNHEFHGKVNADSTANRTRFPRHREHDLAVTATRVNGGTIGILSRVPNGEYQVDHAQNQGSAAVAFRMRP